MIDRAARVDTVKTDETHKKDSACALYKQGHKIAARFHRVLVAAQDALDDDVRIVAGGCNGCVVNDIQTGAYIYYIAQTDCVNRIAIGYGTADSATSIVPVDIAQGLVAAAERLDVDVAWNGDTGKKVYLGDGTFYDN
jgi:adenylosuccinate synthase